MKHNQSLLFLLLLISKLVPAQGKFIIQPLHPTASDTINFSYEPADSNDTAALAAKIYSYYNHFNQVDDVPLNRKTKVLTGSIKTDSSQNLLFIGFSKQDDFNSLFQNKGEGFYVFLNEDGRIKKGAYNSLAISYRALNNRYGIKADDKMVQEAFEKELSQNPENRKGYMAEYLRVLSITEKDSFLQRAQKEIEWLLQEGLKTEDDYSSLETIYALANLKEQAGFVTVIKKERFPRGKWFSDEMIRGFISETDPLKVKAMTPEIVERINMDKNLKEIYPNGEILVDQTFLNTFIKNEDWDGLKKAYNEIDKGRTFKGFSSNFLLQDAVDKMQKGNTHLDFAEALAKTLVANGENELRAPTERLPYYTKKEWHLMREFHLASFKNSLAMVLYKMNRYQVGFRFAQEAMDVNLKNHQGYVDFITTSYALLAEKVLPVTNYKQVLEKLIKEGKYNKQVLDVVKRSYIKEKGSDAGLQSYVAELRKNEIEKIKEELRNSLIKEQAPNFTLLDLDGHKVTLADLKGKIVVLDFWATWCGPCIASFPAMQEVVEYYRDNLNVQFLFIDVAEKEIDKKKVAVDFLAKNKYKFHVLVDKDDRVLTLYVKSGSIPAKFIIDKNGIIRFKTNGNDGGSDLKLIDELKAMIDIAGAPSRD